LKRLKKQPLTDDQLRTAYEKTSLHRIGIPFERGIQIAGVRDAMEGSVRHCMRRAAHAAAPAGKESIPKE